LKKNIVLYHAGCPDGFGSAWAFYQRYGEDADYIPVSHGQSPPSVAGKNVFIVDFSYSKSILEKMKEEADSIVVLDHHKTAEESLSELDFCHFDMNHSGAYLSWVYLFGDSNVPLLIQYIEDRDLWRWKLTASEEILSSLDSYEFSFEKWNWINSKLNVEDSDSWRAIRDEGVAILRYKRALVRSIKRKSHKMTIGDDEIFAVNTPFLQSEIASELSVGEKYAAAYYFDGKKTVFSLRSTKTGSDVSDIAKLYGGGGHRSASGFAVSGRVRPSWLPSFK